jgi:hypothetical protein
VSSPYLASQGVGQPLIWINGSRFETKDAMSARLMLTTPDQAIAACGGNAHEAVKALIVANAFLETDLEKLKAAVSMGYARGKLLPRDRKDWYD